jgi:hypothetical protein
VAALLVAPAVASAMSSAGSPAAAPAAVGAGPMADDPSPLIGDDHEQNRARLTLKPPFAKNDVGTDHTVTATLTKDGKPVKDATILFFVSGANTASGSEMTDANGMAEFTYTGKNPGTDKIVACWDINKNGKCDKFEPTDTAKKVWVKPSPSPSKTSPAASPTGTKLPVTGADTTSLASGGVAITLLGALVLLSLVVYGRWRRRREAAE